jgi:hypothetical protein
MNLWILTAATFIILVMILGLTHLAIDLLAYGLRRLGPGAPILDTAHGAAPYRCTGRDAPFVREGAGR